MNAIKAKKHLYDHIVYDSDGERKFAAELDTNRDVAETKGSMRSMQLRLVEQSKSEHFKAISGEMWCMKRQIATKHCWRRLCGSSACFAGDIKSELREADR